MNSQADLIAQHVGALRHLDDQQGGGALSLRYVPHELTTGGSSRYPYTLPNDRAQSLCEQMSVDGDDVLGEVGDLDDVDSRGLEEFGAFAVDEQAGLAPREYYSGNAGAEDQFGAAPGSRGPAAARLEARVDGGRREAGVVSIEFSDRYLLCMVVCVDLARVAGRDDLVAVVNDDCADREG